MKFEASVLCPLTWEDANSIREQLRNDKKYQYIEVYLGIERFAITNLGIRTFKYPKANIKQAIMRKIDYIINKEI